jgi:hypothetical protein
MSIRNVKIFMNGEIEFDVLQYLREAIFSYFLKIFKRMVVFVFNAKVSQNTRSEFNTMLFANTTISISDQEKISKSYPRCIIQILGAQRRSTSNAYIGKLRVNYRPR